MKAKKAATGEPVLVTGGAGYIGSHVVRDLGEKGYYPVVVDNLSAGKAEAVLCGEFIRADLADTGRLNSLLRRHKIKSVMHFAAFIQVEESVAQPLKYYENNSVNCLRLLRSCLDNGVENFIFSSTAAVYGLPDRIPVNEDAPLRPINPYGSSKLMGELMLRDAAAACPAFRFVALRYFNAVGADAQSRLGQNYQRPTHLLTLALRTALGRLPKLQVFGSDYPSADGTAVRDYIHVDDLASAHLLALEFLKTARQNRVYNCGYGRGFSVLEIIAAVKRVTGSDFPVELAGRRPGDPATLVADSGLIRGELGWTPRYQELDDIIRTAWNWEKKLAAEHRH